MIVHALDMISDSIIKNCYGKCKIINNASDVILNDFCKIDNEDSIHKMNSIGEFVYANLNQ